MGNWNITPDKVITVTPTIGAGADFAFDAGDLIFDSAAIPDAVKRPGGCAILYSIIITDKADQKAAFTLFFANAATDFGTVDAAPDPDDTECATVVGWVDVAASDYKDLGGASVAQPSFTPFMVQAAAGSTALYVAGVNGSGTPNFGGASNLVLQLGFLR